MKMLTRLGCTSFALTLGLVQCSGKTETPGGTPDAAGSDVGVTGGDAGSCQGHPAAGAVPTTHRPTAATCAATAIDAGSGASCTADAECSSSGAASHCLRGACAYDECLSDSDCPGKAACECSTDYYGGNARYHPNVCVTGNCQTDSDCGSGGYCSASEGVCGTVDGYYCHSIGDTCIDPATDCGSCGNACVYTPIVGHFTCSNTVCNG